MRHRLPVPTILWSLLIMLQGTLAPYGYAAGDGVRTTSGIVDEVLPSEIPPVIMVRSKPGTKDEALIGAVVKKGASIVRGKRRIALSHIRPGERVTLTYTKERDGLAVRSIVVHEK